MSWWAQLLLELGSVAIKAAATKLENHVENMKKSSGLEYQKDYMPKGMYTSDKDILEPKESFGTATTGLSDATLRR